MEDPKNTKEDKKEKKSPELKQELSEDELKGVDGGDIIAPHQGHLNKYLDQSPSIRFWRHEGWYSSDVNWCWENDYI